MLYSRCSLYNRVYTAFIQSVHFIYLFQVFVLTFLLATGYIIYFSMQSYTRAEKSSLTNLSETEQDEHINDAVYDELRIIEEAKAKPLVQTTTLSELDKLERSSLSNLTENEHDEHINDAVYEEIRLMKEAKAKHSGKNEIETYIEENQISTNINKDSKVELSADKSHKDRQLERSALDTVGHYVKETVNYNSSTHVDSGSKEKQSFNSVLRVSNDTKEIGNEVDAHKIKHVSVLDNNTTGDSSDDGLFNEDDDDNETDVPNLVVDQSGVMTFEYKEPEFNLDELKIHQAKYETAFNKFPNYQNEPRILAYRCALSCGGLGDRLKGIMQVYMLSILSKRRFAIEMKEPSDLENFLKPNLLDWRLREDEITNISKGQLDNKMLHDAIAAQYERFDYDPVTLYKQDLVYVIANQDWTRSLRKLTITPIRFPEMYKFSSSDLTRIIYHGLFKPSDKLQFLVDDFFQTKAKGKKMACLHARMGEAIYQRYTFDEIMTPLQFLKDLYSEDMYSVLIATDSADVKHFSRTFFSNFIDTSYSGPVMHIDYMKNGKLGEDVKEGAFMRTLLDHMILSRCDTLVLTASGFGVTSAFLRHTSRGLYVYIKEKETRRVVPVRRETLREMFQYKCLAQVSASTYICDG